MRAVYTAADKKSGVCLLSPIDLFDRISLDLDLDEEELDATLDALELDDYFDVTRSDRKGELVYCINMHRKGLAFARVERAFRSNLKFKILLAVAGARAIAGKYVFCWEIVFVIVLLPAVTLFSLGLSYFLSSLYVFFRDLKHIYSVILTLWTYLTPLFYTVSALNNPLVDKYIKLNPMYHYVTYFRDILMGAIPTWQMHLICYGFGILSFVVGYAFLRLVQNRIAAKL